MVPLSLKMTPVCQNKKQSFSFFFLLRWLYFSASGFIDGKDGVRAKSLPTMRKRALNNKMNSKAREEDSHKHVTEAKNNLFFGLFLRSFQS